MLGQGFASACESFPAEGTRPVARSGGRGCRRDLGFGEESGAVPPALQHLHPTARGHPGLCASGAAPASPAGGKKDRKGSVQQLVWRDPAAGVTTGRLSPQALLSTSHLLPQPFPWAEPSAGGRSRAPNPSRSAADGAVGDGALTACYSFWVWVCV